MDKVYNKTLKHRLHISSFSTHPPEVLLHDKNDTLFFVLLDRPNDKNHLKTRTYNYRVSNSTQCHNI